MGYLTGVERYLLFTELLENNMYSFISNETFESVQLVNGSKQAVVRM